MVPQKFQGTQGIIQPDDDGDGRFQQRTATFEQGRTFTSSSIHSPAS